MQGRMILVAIFSCFVASALTASVSHSSGEMFESTLQNLGIDLPDLKERFNSILKEECHSTTGCHKAFRSIENQTDILQTCVMNSINVGQLMDDVEQAQSTNNYGALFSSSCNATHAVLPCFGDFLEAIQICMDEEEKQLTKLIMIITRALMDFTCSKSEEDVRKIMDSKSDECINSKEEQVKACTNSIAMRYGNEDNYIEKTFNLLTKEEGCMELVNLESCVASVFDDCSNKVPVEAGRDLIRSVIEQTPCSGMHSN